MAMFMAPFNAVMLGFGWALVNQLHRRWFKPVAGGVKLRTVLRQTRVRLTEYSPLVVMIASIALFAFFGIFVIAIGFGGFHPPRRVVTVAWVIILATGILSGLWHLVKIISGKYDLILDELNGAVQLPATQGRKSTKSFRLAEIHGIFVDVIETRDSEGSASYRYAPTLRLSGKDGPKEKLAEWMDEERASEFVAWLNEKLGPRTSIYLADQRASTGHQT